MFWELLLFACFAVPVTLLAADLMTAPRHPAQ
jgi:hypothetical protein